jgi:isoquinoline 1-oxidoreductase beta subunit
MRLSMLTERSISAEEHGSQTKLGERGLSRRTLIKAGAAAGGGLLLSFTVPMLSRYAEAAAAGKVYGGPPNAYVRIDRDNAVTMIVPRVEMGQGTYTSLPMLIAEELEVDLNRVRLEHAPPDPRFYTDPLLGEQVTGGSTSIRGAFDPLRRVGASPMGRSRLQPPSCPCRKT